jgi:hypothetical protein
MGLLDVINAMQNSRGGQRVPSSTTSSGGMSPMTMALLGLIAQRALKSFGGAQPNPIPAGGKPNVGPDGTVVAGMPGDSQNGQAVLAATFPLARSTTAFDAAPTTLSLMGFPPSLEMSGRTLAGSELPVPGLRRGRHGHRHVAGLGHHHRLVAANSPRPDARGHSRRLATKRVLGFSVRLAPDTPRRQANRAFFGRREIVLAGLIDPQAMGFEIGGDG